MATDQGTRLTPQEYLAFKRRAPTKHEYIDGELRERPGASRPHVLIAGNIYGLLWTAQRDRPFEVYGTDMRVRIPGGPYYYPDVTVAPSPPRLEDDVADTLLNPLVVVEVLSPSTEDYDRGEKLDDYRLSPSLTDYLVVAQDRVSVDHYRSTGRRWPLQVLGGLSNRVTLAGIACELPLSEIYARVFPPE